MSKTGELPQRITTESELDEYMTRPSPELIETVRDLEGPLLVLGASGKMGPSLAVRALRAAREAGCGLSVIAVSRFSDAAARSWLEERGVRTVSADLFDEAAVREIPEAANIIYMVGAKFGTTSDPSRTWAVNTIIPLNVARRFPSSRIVAISSGNVYPLVPAKSAGCVETDPLTPLGEYPNAAVARERIFEFFSRRDGLPLVLIRLNYALDLRYGVLVDIARNVAAEKPVDLAMGYLNCIWQGDANDMILRALPLASSPPRVLNVTGPETLAVRALAERFGALFEREVTMTGQEAPTALLNDARGTCAVMGEPPTPIARVIEWTADWIKQSGRLLDKPTGFQVRDGVF